MTLYQEYANGTHWRIKWPPWLSMFVAGRRSGQTSALSYILDVCAGRVVHDVSGQDLGGELGELGLFGDDATEREETEATSNNFGVKIRPVAGCEGCQIDVLVLRRVGYGIFNTGCEQSPKCFVDVRYLYPI